MTTVALVFSMLRSKQKVHMLTMMDQDSSWEVAQGVLILMNTV